jgi:hypothetical protein
LWRGIGRVLSTHRSELLLEHHDERLTDRRLDLAIRAGSGAQKKQGNYCTICCTTRDTGGQLAGSLTLLRLNVITRARIGHGKVVTLHVEGEILEPYAALRPEASRSSVGPVGKQSALMSRLSLVESRR